MDDRTALPDLVARAAALRAQLRAEEDEADLAGHYSTAAHEAFSDAGFYRILCPARYGGLELGFEPFYRVTLELATAHPGAAWCFALSASHLWIVASHFPADVQDEVLGSGRFLAPFSGSFNGRCRRVDGGIEVEGTFGYASGVPFATHLLGVVRIQEGDAAEVRLALFPRSSFTLLDDWGGDKTSGLRASGSFTVAVAKTVVPDRHTIPYTGFLTEPAARARPTPGTELHDNPAYLGPLAIPFHLNLLAVVVGAARAAIADFEAVSHEKHESLPPFGLRRDNPLNHFVLGEAIAKTAAAEAVLFSMVEQFEARCRKAVDGGEPFTIEDNLRIWSIGHQAAELAGDAVRLLFANSGSSAGRRNNRMARYLNDVSMYTTHPVANPYRVYPMLGRARLGLPAGFFGLDG
ncbi:MAG: hypothetical protein IT196_27145 [Acidimicrobiales bacterium]|nr:hypothetical protein [Acidimicrobiales bacterium]